MSTLPDAALVPEARSLSSCYEFLSELGRGGMGIVYLARERADGRAVAIKLLSASSAHSAESAIRFAREAQTVASLDHPNIVRTLGIEPLSEGGVAIVSEYVQGHTLRGVLRESGRLPFDRAISILRGVAGALAHAHRHRIIHRDVKPENIFVEAATGRALLSDFGIARPLDADIQLTIAGASFGTPSYMAPEQVKGAALDERADVYSLGLVGWEMLTGARPWEGETLYDVLHKQQHEPLPSLAALRPDIPSYLLVAIEGALAKSASDRWANGSTLLERLTPTPAALPPRRVPGTAAWNESVDQQAPISRAGADAVVPAPRNWAVAEPDDAPTVRISVPPPVVASPEAPPKAPPEASPAPVEAVRASLQDLRTRAPVTPPVVRVEQARPPIEPSIEPSRPPIEIVRAPVGNPHSAFTDPKPGRRRRMPAFLGPVLVAVAAALGALLILTGTDLRGGVRAIGSAFPWARTDSARTDSSVGRAVAVRDSSNARLADRTPVAPRRAPPAATPRTPAPRTPATRTPASRTPAPRAPAASATRVTRPPVTTPTTAPATSRPASNDARCGTPGNDAQRACLLSAIDRNDAALNRTYQVLIARMRRDAGGAPEPPAVQALRVEQRAWVAQRDRACGRTGAASGGGLWGADRVPCFARMSDSRESVLRRRVQARE